MTDFSQAKIAHMARSSSAAARLRRSTRAMIVNSGTPEQRLALDLAVKGYGVEQVKLKAGIEPELAQLLVLGTMPLKQRGRS